MKTWAGDIAWGDEKDKERERQGGREREREG